MPTGIQRTWPNLMTQEGVRGQEYNAWDRRGGNPPAHTVTLPFTRGLGLCPQLIIVEPHFQRYKEVSSQLHEIFHDYTDLIEPISLDEAFLDVTDNKKGMELGVDIAREIKQRIRETTGLTASAGVSYQ